MKTPCVEWTGAFNPVTRYGQTRLPGASSTTTAHRAAWIKAFGPIAPGLHVAHACDNRRCVNLDHLFLATPRENLEDMIAKGRARWDKSTGELNGQAKLTADAVKDIRSSTVSPRHLAARYGVSANHIWQVRTRKVWQHVA